VAISEPGGPVDDLSSGGLHLVVEVAESLRVHAKRHYDDAAVTAYWRARMHKELMNALGG